MRVCPSAVAEGRCVMNMYDDDTECVCDGCGQSYIPTLGQTTDYTCEWCSDIDAINEYVWAHVLEGMTGEA